LYHYSLPVDYQETRAFSKREFEADQTAPAININNVKSGVQSNRITVSFASHWIRIHNEKNTDLDVVDCVESNLALCPIMVSSIIR